MARRLRPKFLVRRVASVPTRTRVRKGRLAILVLSVVMLAALVALLTAFHSHEWQLTTSALAAGPPQAAQSVDPPGTIDGAKNPELIPDDVAYRVVLLALAEPESATEGRRPGSEPRLRRQDSTKTIRRHFSLFSPPFRSNSTPGTRKWTRFEPETRCFFPPRPTTSSWLNSQNSESRFSKRR